MTKADVAQLMFDQVTSFAEGCSRKQPMIEADCFDDAEGIGFLPLDRWGDRRFKVQDRRWPGDWH